MGDKRKKGPLGRSAEDTRFEVEVVLRKSAATRGPAGNVKTSSKQEVQGSTNHANTASSEDVSKPKEKPTVPPKPTRPKKPAKESPVLKQGHSGKDVEKLQRLLNVRMVNYPDLDVDGIFGSKTHEAVKDYQTSVGIASDGIVGKQTWYHLLKGDESNAGKKGAAAKQTQVTRASTQNVSAGKVHQKASPRRQQEEAVWEWSFEKKILAVLERVPDRLPGKAKEEFKQLLQLENIALSLVIIAGFCLLSGGTALVLGVFILGFDICMSLGSALLIASWAATKDELNEAADEISHLIITVGVGAFFKGVGKIAKRIKGRSKTGKGSGSDNNQGTGESSKKSKSTKKDSSKKENNKKTPPKKPVIRTKEELMNALKGAIKDGKIDVDKLKQLVPEGTPNTFRPSNTIASGQKYRFQLSDGTKVEIKWHSPDANAARRFPGSNSGTKSTAQIKVGRKLLKQNGSLKNPPPDNSTHIPIE